MTCDVVLPVPVRSAFTYRVPEALSERAVPGARVLVPFRKRTMVGVIVECGRDARKSARAMARGEGLAGFVAAAFRPPRFGLD